VLAGDVVLLVLGRDDQAGGAGLAGGQELIRSLLAGPLPAQLKRPIEADLADGLLLFEDAHHMPR
jgi:hypothetical protein